MSENFVAVPWSIEGSDLDPYQFRLWVHVKRVGICWQSIRTMAGACNMSVAKTHEVKGWLLENGYIEEAIDKEAKRVGVRACSPHEQTQQEERSPREHRSPHEQSVRHTNGQRSPHERHLKKNPKEEYLKEREEPAREAGADVEIVAFLDANDIAHPETDVEWEQIRHPAVWAWVEATRQFPGYDKLPAIIRRLGDEPDCKALALAWEDWVASDYRKANATGVLDYYEKRQKPARASPNGHHSSDPRAAEQPESDPVNWKKLDPTGATF